MRSLHEVRSDAFNYTWDNAIEPVLSVSSGEEVLLHVRDASDEQITAGSDASAIANLDFGHVNPVSGPVEVRGAKPGDTLQVEILEFAPREWGWTALIPGFGLLADEFPDPWLRISQVDPESGRVRFLPQLIDQLVRTPDLGHPFGPNELMTVKLSFTEMVKELQNLGLVKEGESGLEITGKGLAARAIIRDKPREGLLFKILNRISANLYLKTLLHPDLR